MRLALFLASLIVLMSLLLVSCDNAPTNSVSSQSPVSHISGRSTDAPSTAADMPETQIVMFGNPRGGSPFPPGSGHDASYHGVDRIIPQTVVIPAGGDITFMVHEFHQVAIYAPGTEPEDIAAHVASGEATLEDLVTPFIIIPDFIIDDPINRLALSPFSIGEFEWHAPEGTFDTPGRYFMICTVVPHFFESKMYGWIIVK